MTQGASAAFLELTPLARGEPGENSAWKKHWESRMAKAREWYDLGCSCNARGQFERAAQALECSLELSPYNMAVEFELGRALSALGRPDQAEILFESIIHRDPGNERVALPFWY